MDVQTEKFHWVDGKVYCYDPRLANKLNKILTCYVDCVFQEGEEGIFKVPPAQIGKIWRALLKLDSTIIHQVSLKDLQALQGPSAGLI